MGSAQLIGKQGEERACLQLQDCLLFVPCLLNITDIGSTSSKEEWLQFCADKGIWVQREKKWALGNSEGKQAIYCFIQKEYMHLPGDRIQSSPRRLKFFSLERKKSCLHCWLSWLTSIQLHSNQTKSYSSLRVDDRMWKTKLISDNLVIFSSAANSCANKFPRSLY